MSDDDFITGFEAGTLMELPHRSHVRLACLYLDRFAAEEALEQLLAGLKRFAAAKGHPGKFHYTMTRAWLELIVCARRRHPDARDAGELFVACPLLADSRVLSRYYSDALLSSAAAREDWMPPDRAPIGAGL